MNMEEQKIKQEAQEDQRVKKKIKKMLKKVYCKESEDGSLSEFKVRKGRSKAV